jgi:chemotaxis protein MotB
MLRRKIQEESHRDRWLVSYADFITLLFAFFVVMYSISSVNEGKYKVLSETLEGIFNVRQTTMKPIQVGDEAARAEYPLEGDELIRPIPTNPEEINEKRKPEPDDVLEQIAGEFSESFNDLVFDDQVEVQLLDEWLEVSLKDQVIFQSGGVEPADNAFPIIQTIARVLRDHKNGILVEGHTDNFPIRSEKYQSNWELSAARAATFVQYLAIEGIEEPRMVAAGFGEFRPLARNDTPAGRTKNRRIVLLISRTTDVHQALLN